MCTLSTLPVDLGVYLLFLGDRLSDVNIGVLDSPVTGDLDPTSYRLCAYHDGELGPSRTFTCDKPISGNMALYCKLLQCPLLL